MNLVRWRKTLADSLPFYYGWAIVASTVPVSLSARTIMAVATLFVFVVPMAENLGWSRVLFSGAISLGGLCAVFISPRWACSWTGTGLDCCSPCRLR